MVACLQAAEFHMQHFRKEISEGRPGIISIIYEDYCWVNWDNGAGTAALHIFTRLLLHAYSYTPTLTRLALPRRFLLAFVYLFSVRASCMVYQAYAHSYTCSYTYT